LNFRRSAGQRKKIFKDFSLAIEDARNEVDEPIIILGGINK